MRRLLSSLFRALGNLRQSWVVSTITTAIISICLLLVGGYILMIHNIDNVIENMQGDVRVTIYLRDGFPMSDTNLLHDRLTGLAEVESVTYTSKSDALVEFESMLGNDSDLLDGMDEIPLPASLRLTPKPEYRTSEGIHSILGKIGDDSLVEDIQYGEDWLGRLEKILVVLNTGAVVLGAILSLAAIFIIANTIKLTVLARRDELEIMRLVGATEAFIRTPFLIEGLIQGLAGAVFSMGFLVFLHRFVEKQLAATVFDIIGIRSLEFLSTNIIIAILLCGMLLGGIGSMASVGRFSR